MIIVELPIPVDYLW